MGSWKSRYGKKKIKPGAPSPRTMPLPELLQGKHVRVAEFPGQAKMSEVLFAFLEPYSELWENENQLNKLLSIATVAWNAANLPAEHRDEMIQSCLEALPADVRRDGRAIIDELIRRKEQHFADNKRAIVSYQLTMTARGAHLNVISTPEGR